MQTADPNDTIIERPSDLTPEWLTAAVGAGTVTAFTSERIGTGQMSESRRVTIGYAPGPDGGPATVVLKTAAADENSRAAGVGLGVYDREVRFYRELAERVGGPLPACHFAAIDPAEGWFTLLLEDVSPAVQGDQIAGCSVEQARLAMHELARLHAPVIGSDTFAEADWPFFTNSTRVAFAPTLACHGNPLRLDSTISPATRPEPLTSPATRSRPASTPTDSVWPTIIDGEWSFRIGRAGSYWARCRYTARKTSWVTSSRSRSRTPSRRRELATYEACSRNTARKVGGRCGPEPGMAGGGVGAGSRFTTLVCGSARRSVTEKELAG